MGHNNTNNLKILNLNTQGLGLARRGLKVTLFAAQLPMYDPDIFTITETHMSDFREVQQLEKLLPLYHCTSSLGIQRRNGIICGFRKNKFNVIDKFMDDEGRILSTRIRDKDSNTYYNVMGVYAPAREAERYEYWRKLREFTIFQPDIVIGDFNCIIHDSHALGGIMRHVRYSSEKLKEYTTENSLTNCIQENINQIFTWASPEAHLFRFFDYVFHNKNKLQLKKLATAPCSFSDHLYVITKYDIPNKGNKFNFWKLNAKLIIPGEQIYETVSQDLNNINNGKSFQENFKIWTKYKNRIGTKFRSLEIATKKAEKQ